MGLPLYIKAVTIFIYFLMTPAAAACMPEGVGEEGGCTPFLFPVVNAAKVMHDFFRDRNIEMLLLLLTKVGVVNSFSCIKCHVFQRNAIVRYSLLHPNLDCGVVLLLKKEGSFESRLQEKEDMKS